MDKKCVEVAEWIDSNGWTVHAFKGKGSLWTNSHDVNDATTTELLQLFNQQNKG
jgi:hypothetical protein